MSKEKRVDIKILIERRGKECIEKKNASMYFPLYVSRRIREAKKKKLCTYIYVFIKGKEKKGRKRECEREKEG